MTEPSLAVSKQLRSVGRAAADLRRGLAVAISDGGGGFAVMRAAENLSDAGLEELRQLVGEIDGATARILLTAQRAEVLHIVHRHEAAALPGEARHDAAALNALADPTSDLAHPMRGPFSADKAAPSPAVMASLSLCKHSRLLPSAVAVSGEHETASALRRWTEEYDVLSVAAEDVDVFTATQARALRVVTSARVPLDGAENSRIVAFRPPDGGVEHLAIVVGDPATGDPVLTRIHSECFTGDLLGSLKCDCGEQLRGAIQEMGDQGGGVLLYLAQEGRGIGLINKLRAYQLQDQGFDTIDANERLGFEADERIFRPAAEMLWLLGFGKVRLMTNNPEKIDGLAASGIDVIERVEHSFPSNAHNEYYLSTKRRRSGHLL